MMRKRGLTEEAATASIDQACRMLRLPTIRQQFKELTDGAAREQMSYRAFLAALLMAECDDRARRRSERRIRAASFPREKSLRAFDFEANPNVDPATVNTLATCEWVKKGEPLCLIGDSGTGKSHLLISLGTEAAMQGFRVRYALATKLVNELVEAADDKQLSKTIARYGRVDLLCIDLCRARDYAEPHVRGSGRCGPGTRGAPHSRGCITDARGTRGPCRWAGSGPAGHPPVWCGRGPSP
ncbi:ATP-binding protein [Streptomyces sp. B-S-A6]|uniref:ATP-binding protein n=1 Tax=Streptomyces cavernicola TaxID=3043613 RepID=A0ABT6S539_9ACTN|nr:ATP-binding protein [Streptomyces sp. B-S-A6]MDI3403177.1 ATP-binding protein [Streptomyces sp. B-S-A6]